MLHSNSQKQVKCTVTISHTRFLQISEPEVDNGPYDPIKVSANYHNKITQGQSYEGKYM